MIEVKVDTLRLQMMFSELALKFRDRTIPNRQVSVQLYEWVMRNFKVEGGLTEQKHWTPLKESTKKAKARKGYRMILQNTGALRQSFMPFSSNDYAGVGAQQKFTSHGRPYDLARIHEKGNKTIPARPMLPTKQQALTMAIKVYDWHIKRIIAGAK